MDKSKKDEISLLVTSTFLTASAFFLSLALGYNILTNLVIPSFGSALIMLIATRLIGKRIPGAERWILFFMGILGTVVAIWVRLYHVSKFTSSCGVLLGVLSIVAMAFAILEIDYKFKKTQ